MRLARRFVPPAPALESGAARARVTRARGLASVLLGALAGLALASAIVAAAPVVGRTAASPATAAASNGVGGSGHDPDPDEEASSIAAVLAPAIEAGVAVLPTEAARP